MAEIRVTRVQEGGGTKIRNVPIAVTPEGFWCCPSPVIFQKTTLKHPPNPTPPPPPINKSKTPKSKTQTQTQTSVVDKKPSPPAAVAAPISPSPVVSDPARTPKPKIENLAKKVSIEFGDPGTTDLKLILFGKQGFSVKLSLHKAVLVDNSSFFAHKFLQEGLLHSLEIKDCEDVEIYVETVSLMYSKELKQRLIKQTVSRVLRILEVAEQLGFNVCIESCLEYLEAVPWVGEEEEDRVVSSVLRLQGEGGIGINPAVLKRVSCDTTTSKPHNDTLSHILQLVLTSNEEKGRREMKSVVLKLLRKNNNNSLPNSSSSNDICNETIYASCTSCLNSLLSFFRQAAEPEFTCMALNMKEGVVKQMALQADNLTWLLEILTDRQAADEFAVIWAGQHELAALHEKLPIVSRHHVSCVTARLLVGIGRGELLPSKDTRHLLLKTWLQPLMNDYNWLQHGCRSFDRKLVEEGIGRTILTLPLEDQQSMLLGWLGSFLKAGDNCPNLQRAFEVWWRRTFVRPYHSHTSIT